LKKKAEKNSMKDSKFIIFHYSYSYLGKFKQFPIISAEVKRNAGIACKFSGDSGIHHTKKRCDKTGMTQLSVNLPK